jgi:hypothetical protein
MEVMDINVTKTSLNLFNKKKLNYFSDKTEVNDKSEDIRYRLLMMVVSSMYVFGTYMAYDSVG